MNETDVKEALVRAGRYRKVDDNLYVKEVILKKDKREDEGRGSEEDKGNSNSSSSNSNSNRDNNSRRYIVCYNPLEAEHDREARHASILRLLSIKNVKSLIHNRMYRKLILPDGSSKFKINEEKIKERE